MSGMLQPGQARILAPEELPLVFMPEGFDPLADGVMMAHQKVWLEDRSPLKLAEKGRRTGITWAEAFDTTLIAAAAKSAGGEDTYYIGDTQAKGLEFIQTCSKFAQAIARELTVVSEFLFEDKRSDGNTRYISAYRIVFASGHKIVALSSRPENIRGLQGRVIVDEAAFHHDVRLVLDACNALLIWGSVIRVISTHNGASNPFNELIKEIHEGKYPYSLHRVTFDDAVANGLYERVCLLRGKTPTPKDKADWYNLVRKSYGTRIEAMQEELDVIPREGEGVLLPLSVIEACQTPDYVVKRWTLPAADFVDWPEADRRRHVMAWFVENVVPILRKLPRETMFFGEDFAMRQDRTAIAAGYVDLQMVRHVPLIIELHRCPYNEQKLVLFTLLRLLRAWRRGVMDANGNGMVLAQEARQRFGAGRIVELMPSDNWLRATVPQMVDAFINRRILIPADRDVRDDLAEFRSIRGVGRIPTSVRKGGTDGKGRHADTAIAILNFWSATTATGPLPAGETVDDQIGDSDQGADDIDEARGGLMGGFRRRLNMFGSNR